MENKSEKHKEKGGAKRSLPRTRDDSSDEEDISTSCVPATLPNGKHMTPVKNISCLVCIFCVRFVISNKF